MTAYRIELLGYQHIKGKIKCLTGLRIGGASDVIEIGGLDNPIIKHPLTKEPYIPGSSLKGKMRSLLELYENKIDSSGNVCSCGEPDCVVCRLFGISGSQGSKFGPGRLIVRDAKLCSIDDGQPGRKRNLKQTEIKYENVINRIKGTAEHPRQMERVPAGAVFDFSMSYRVFSVQNDKESTPDNGTKDKEFFDTIFKCMRLLEKDTLGSSGSRGYGQIRFEDINVTYLDGSSQKITLDDSLLTKNG